MVYTNNVVKTGRFPRIDRTAPIDPAHSSDDWVKTPYDPRPAPMAPERTPGGMEWVQGYDQPPQNPTLLADPSHTAGEAPRAYDSELAWARESTAIHSEVTFQPERHPAGLYAAGTAYQVDMRGGMGGWEPDEAVLKSGRNPYGIQNPDHEMWGPDGFNRGHDEVTFGHYESYLNPWREYDLRAVGREEVVMPVDTPAQAEPAPWNSPFSGNAFWLMPNSAEPMMYQPPATTGITDRIMADEYGLSNSAFTDGETL